jgi:hypothetical protein
VSDLVKMRFLFRINRKRWQGIFLRTDLILCYNVIVYKENVMKKDLIRDFFNNNIHKVDEQDESLSNLQLLKNRIYLLVSFLCCV